MEIQIKGIDVSKYQGKIDWEKVKASGVKFAFIRCGFCRYDGSVEIDPLYHDNMAGANAAGVDVGVYLYSYANSEAGMVRAARETLALCKPYRVGYPVVLDIEETQDTLYTKRKKAANSELCRSFLNIVEQAGYYAMLYTYTYFADSYLDMALLARYDAWIADYRGYVGYKGAYGIWQYSAKGSVSGISADVDMNWAGKDYAGLIAKLGLNGLKAEPAPNPAPNPGPDVPGDWKVETGPFKADKGSSTSAKAGAMRSIYELCGYEALILKTVAGDALKVQVKGLEKEKAQKIAVAVQNLTGWQTNAYKII